MKTTNQEKVNMSISMNEKLKNFLETLDDKNADEIWTWLDENENAIDDMIGVLCLSHQHLQ